MPSKNILLVVFFYAWGPLLLAQNGFPPFTISKVTTDDGLSQGSNYFRYEDSRGFMWLTGNDALNRYDGKMIKVYNLAKYFSNCPTLQQGYGFAEDDTANLYIGSTRGLYIYHRNQDKFTLQPIFSQNTDSVAMPFGFKDGKVWCFNKQYQLATYDVRTKAVTLVAKLGLEPLASIHVYNMPGNAFYYRFPFIDKTGAVWAVSQHTIAAYQIETGKISYPFAAYLLRRKLELTCSAHNNDQLICGTNKGLTIFNTSTGAITEVNTLENSALSKVRYVACHNQFIVFRTISEIGYYSMHNSKNGRLDKRIFERYGKLLNFSFDKSGRLWACDDGTGLVVFDFTIPALNKEPNDNHPDICNVGFGCHNFAELDNGDILVRHNVAQDSYTKTIHKYPFEFYTEPDATSYRMCTDRYRKGVWVFEENIASQQLVKRFYFCTHNTGKKITVPLQPNGPKSQQNDMGILADGRILCSFSEGLYWLSPVNKQLKKVDAADKRNAFKIDTLSKNRIAVSYLESNMLLYQVLPQNGLALLKPILPGVQSFYIQEDTVKRCYWIGSNEGVYLLDSNFKMTNHFDANNGLAGTYIYGLLLDDAGNVYCSHQRGLSRIDTRSFQIINYNKNDGIQDWDFHNRAFYKTSDGTLYFGGAKGFNYIQPIVQQHPYYKPEVYVDEILVGGKPYDADVNANNIATLQLGYNENDLSIKAVVKDLAKANLHYLIYRIVETGAEWQMLPNNSPINFTQLAPGSYTLQLGYYNKYLSDKVLQKTIRITIAAPFYRKGWFWAAVAILVTAGVFKLINRQKLAKQKIKFQEQLALEKQRQKITADLHDDIGASLSSLQINSAVAGQLLAKDTHAAQNLLTKIEEQARSLADKIGDIVWSLKPGKDEFMTLSRRVKNFANEILGSSQILHSVNIGPGVDSLTKDIALRKNLVLIMKEAINNAAKYSQATEVVIAMQHKQGYIYLQVADNGVGFDPMRATGNGIDNMRKRATELGGSLTIQSAPGKGTEVSALIPLVP